MKFPKLIKGRMRLIPYWPLFVTPAIIIPAILVYTRDRESGIINLIFLCIYGIFALVWMILWKRHLVREIAVLYENFDKTQSKQLRSMPLPYALIDAEGYLLWENDALQELMGDYSGAARIDSVFPELASLTGAETDKTVEVKVRDRIFEAKLTLIKSEDQVAAVSFFDVTRLRQAVTLAEQRRPVVVQINIDNYEEAMASAEMVRRPLLAALIERKINKYFASYGGIVSKTEKDKFVAFLDKKGYEGALANRFSVLEEVKALNIGNDVKPTLSMGIGLGGEGISEGSRYAVMALDLCLGRGGDQAVVKTPEGAEFFGGKLEHTDKTTKVKARTMAQALKEVMLSKQKIYIMGHKIPDADSLGAAVGIYCIARTLDKEAHIVFETASSGIRPMYERLKSDGSFPAGTFITGEEARNGIDELALVVLVDVNRPSYSECPDLLAGPAQVVVIDHHRQSEETVDNAVLSYIEPYASSASELITEMIQYVSDGLKPTVPEAEALYGGIVIDTDNFLTKTGTRTFEAAAYLRRCGADMARVRKLFRDRMEDFRAKAETVSGVELYERYFAMGICNGTGLESPMIVGAQAANELMGIDGVKASLVFTPYNGKIYISARSIDEINVQLIMERLGGGGHLSVAGAQLSCSLEEAIQKTKKTISDMLKEGAI